MSDDSATNDAAPNDSEADNGSDDDDDATAAPTTATAVLEYLAKAVVSQPDDVRIEVDETHRTTQLLVFVDPDDMGRVIGKRGRVANAIRTVVSAAAVRDGVEVEVEFVD